MNTTTAGNGRGVPVLVLTSGGIDSTACLTYHLERGAHTQALFIDFGQLAVREESRATRAVCRYFGVPLNVLRCRSDAVQFGEGLIRGRNAFFLFAALTFFPQRNGLICYGAHGGTEYYDCSRPFVRATRQLIQAYTHGTIDLSVPFLRFSKRQIVNYCRQRDVPLHLTHSCERGGRRPCRRCSTCRTLTQIGYYDARA